VLTPVPLSEAVEAFLLSRSVGGCTSRTVQLYREVLSAFLKGATARDLCDCSLSVVQTYLTSLRERVNATTAHLHFSKLRAYFGWCVESGLLTESPLRGVSMRAPKTLPRVSEDEAIRRLLQTCSDTSRDGGIEHRWQAGAVRGTRASGSKIGRTKILWEGEPEHAS